MKSLTIPAIMISALLLLASCGKEDKKEKIPSAQDAIPVKVISLNKEETKPAIHSSGQFTTDDETVLSFKTGGIINGLFVKEGDAVKQGQLLATLDLTEISAQVKLAEIGYEKALRDYTRMQNLYKDSVTTQEQLQNTKTGLELSEQQLNAARFNLRYSEIRALKDGVVLKKFANEGQMIGSGMPVIQVNSAGKSDWILRVSVSDREWAQIAINDKAEITTDAIEGKIISAIVSSKSEGIDPYSGSLQIELKLSDSKSCPVAAGMFGKATIFPSKTTSAWKIPYQALLDGDANTGFVFVTNDDKTAIRVPVKIASLENDYLLISEGLEHASKLIVSGSAYLTDHSSIKISQ